MSERLGILLAGSPPPALVQRHGDYAVMFANWLQTWRPLQATRIYRAFDGELPTSATDADLWLITGSRFSVLDDAPWMRSLEALVQSIVQEQRPLCGICFGHQVVATALGGTVRKWPGGWRIGRQRYSWNEGDGAQSIEVAMNAFHEDQVVTPPDTAQVLASSSTCPYAALRYGDTVITTQAHPEFRDEYLRELIRIRLAGKLDDPDLEAAIGSLDQPIDIEPATRLLLSRFFPAY